MEQSKSKYCTCLYHTANALSRIMTKISDEEFASVGLSSSYAFLLMTVNEKQGVQPKEISKQMQLTASTVTRLIEKMEYRGLLERKSVGRSTEVYSTKAGLALQPQLKKIWQRLYKRYSDILGKPVADQLTIDIFQATQLLE
jgi:DNA-binding MarR family transcriptional regulator